MAFAARGPRTGAGLAWRLGLQAQATSSSRLERGSHQARFVLTLAQVAQHMCSSVPSSAGYCAWKGLATMSIGACSQCLHRTCTQLLAHQAVASVLIARLAVSAARAHTLALATLALAFAAAGAVLVACGAIVQILQRKMQLPSAHSFPEVVWHTIAAADWMAHERMKAHCGSELAHT